jgi:hypothetical protein
MVGTTRFELATSPTPRVRSTRLSHVPTVLARQPRRATAGYVAELSVHEGRRIRPSSYRENRSVDLNQWRLLRSRADKLNLEDRWPLFAGDEKPVMLGIIGNTVQNRLIVDLLVCG